MPKNKIYNSLEKHFQIQHGYIVEQFKSNVNNKIEMIKGKAFQPPSIAQSVLFIDILTRNRFSSVAINRKGHQIGRLSPEYRQVQGHK